MEVYILILLKIINIFYVKTRNKSRKRKMLISYLNAFGYWD